MQENKATKEFYVTCASFLDIDRQTLCSEVLFYLPEEAEKQARITNKFRARLVNMCQKVYVQSVDESVVFCFVFTFTSIVFDSCAHIKLLYYCCCFF